jgi:hypothetical protein
MDAPQTSPHLPPTFSLVTRLCLSTCSQNQRGCSNFSVVQEPFRPTQMAVYPKLSQDFCTQP